MKQKLALVLTIAIAVSIVVAMNFDYEDSQEIAITSNPYIPNSVVATTTEEHVCLEVEKFSDIPNRPINEFKKLDQSAILSYPDTWVAGSIEEYIAYIRKKDQTHNEYNNRNGETYFMPYSMGVYFEDSAPKHVSEEEIAKHRLMDRALSLAKRNKGSYCVYQSPINLNKIYVLKEYADGETKWMNQYTSFQMLPNKRFVEVIKPGHYSGELSDDDLRTFFFVTNSVKTID